MWFYSLSRGLGGGVERSGKKGRQKALFHHQFKQAVYQK